MGKMIFPESVILSCWHCGVNLWFYPESSPYDKHVVEHTELACCWRCRDVQFASNDEDEEEVDDSQPFVPQPYKSQVATGQRLAQGRLF